MEANICNSHNLHTRFPFRCAPLQSGLASRVSELSQPLNKKYFLLFFFFICEISFAQNLVPNPSFEDTLRCPNAVNQVDSAVGWIAYKGSPDYFLHNLWLILVWFGKIANMEPERKGKPA